MLNAERRKLDFIQYNLEVSMKGRQYSMNVQNVVILGQSIISIFDGFDLRYINWEMIEVYCIDIFVN